MKLSFSTNAFGRHSVVAAVERIAAAGYEGVEILADMPHLYADTVTQSDLDALKEALGRTGLRTANVNANTATGYYGCRFWEPVFEPSLANPEPEARAWRVAYTKKCIDMAHELESPCISITSGRMVPGTDPERSLVLLKESLDEILEHAARRGILVGIEYEPGLLIECCEELARLLEELDAPNLGANLDLGHSHVLGEDPEAVVERLSPRIFHVHIEDIRHRKHYHLIPGLGDMDFRRLFRAFGAHSYDGFVTVELYTYPHEPEEAAVRSIEHLKPFMTSYEGEAR